MLDLTVLFNLEDRDFELVSNMAAFKGRAEDYFKALEYKYKFPVGVNVIDIRKGKIGSVRETINHDGTWIYSKNGETKAYITITEKKIYEILRDRYLINYGLELKEELDEEVYNAFKELINDALRDYNDFLYKDAE